MKPKLSEFLAALALAGALRAERIHTVFYVDCNIDGRDALACVFAAYNVPATSAHKTFVGTEVTLLKEHLEIDAEIPSLT